MSPPHTQNSILIILRNCQINNNNESQKNGLSCAGLLKHFLCRYTAWTGKCESTFHGFIERRFSWSTEQMTEGFNRVHSLDTSLCTPCYYWIGMPFAFRATLDSIRCWKYSLEILVHIVVIASPSCCRFIYCTSLVPSQVLYWIDTDC